MLLTTIKEWLLLNIGYRSRRKSGQGEYSKKILKAEQPTIKEVEKMLILSSFLGVSSARDSIIHRDYGIYVIAGKIFEN